MKYYTLLILACIGNSLFAQNATLTSDAALKKIKAEYPQEKVFLQTDKNQYIVGETVWMKAWCMMDGMPTFLSRILYVDMVDGKGKVVLKKMYKLDSLSSTPADFDLPTTFKTGNYSINAYTLWMLNFPEFVFRKNIFVYASDYNKSSTQKTLKPELKIQFFPEGGDIIGGLKNRVAFKAYDVNGFPVEVKGNITDSKGKQVASFSSEHDGMGTIEIDAESDVTYTANISASNGTILQYKLPLVKESGIVLRVENANPNKIFVLVNRTERNKEKFAKVKLVAQMNNQQFFSVDLSLDEAQSAAPINKKNLPAGIVHITLFDADNNPLAERLVFVSNYDIEQPNIKIDAFNKNARSKSIISFSIDSLLASLSVSVVNASLDNSIGAGENIASSMLLTSDLKGYINNPGYYFKNKEAATLQHLDLLLMTQGWRRFEWKKILQNNFAALKYPVESSISIRGTVSKSDRDIAVKDGRVSFLIRGDDSTRIMANASVTDKGEFLLSDINYRKKATISYQGTNNKKEGLIVDVKLVPAFIDSLTKSSYVPIINLDTIDLAGMKDTWAKYFSGGVIIDTSKATYLGNVTVKAKRISKEDSLNNEYATGPFVMGKGLNPEDYKNYTTIWQMLQIAVPGIRVEGNFFDPTVSFSRYDGSSALSENTGTSANIGTSSAGESVDIVLESNGIAYYLNEINVSKDVISSLSIDDIALIKVLKSEAMVLGASQGAIAFYTKKGVAIRNSVYEKTFTNIERAGYAVVREFYMPDYKENPLLNRYETDKRYTLYWNGKIRPAKDGKYRFSFFNNDITDKFKLVIQGYDKEGNFIFKEQVIQ